MFNNILKEAFADLQASNQLVADEQLAAIEAGMEALEKEVDAQANTFIHDEEYQQLETGMFQLVGMVDKLEVLSQMVEGQEELSDAHLDTVLLAFNQIMEPAGIQLAAEDVKKPGATPAENKKSVGEKIKGGASSALATLKKWITAFIDGARKIVQKYLTANGLALIAARKTQAAIKAFDYKKYFWESQMVITTNAGYLLKEWDGKAGAVYDEVGLAVLFKRLQETANPADYRNEVAGIIKELGAASDDAKIQAVIGKAVEATKKYLGASKSESGQGGVAFSSEDMGGSLYYYVVVPTKGAPRVGAKFRNPKIGAMSTAFGSISCPNGKEMAALADTAVAILEGIEKAKTAYEDMRAFSAAVDEVVKAEGVAAGVQTAVSTIAGLYQQAVNLQMTHSGRFARNASAIALNARAVLTRKEKAAPGDDKAEPEKK